MITFNPKTWSHEKFLESIGYATRRKGGAWELISSAGIVTDQTEIDNVQAQIDAYDPLPDERQRWADTVDVAAGEARRRYITIAPGQDITYELKRVQAEAHKAAGYPADLTEYPMVAAEQGVLGGTAQEATDYILGKSAQWQQLAAAIEQLRRGAKVAMDADTNAADIAATAQTAIDALGAV